MTRNDEYFLKVFKIVQYSQSLNTLIGYRSKCCFRFLEVEGKHKTKRTRTVTFISGIFFVVLLFRVRTSSRQRQKIKQIQIHRFILNV